MLIFIDSVGGELDRAEYVTRNSRSTLLYPLHGVETDVSPPFPSSCTHHGKRMVS